MHGVAPNKAAAACPLPPWRTALYDTVHGAGELLFLLVSRLSFWGLWAGTFLGVWSLAIYFKNVWVHFVYPEGSKKAQ